MPGRSARFGDRGGGAAHVATLGVWDATAADAQPILNMIVTNSKLKDAAAVFLTFAGEVRTG